MSTMRVFSPDVATIFPCFLPFASAVVSARARGQTCADAWRARRDCEAKQMADDELWGVRNAFHLGCFQQAIAEAMNVSEDSRVLANFYTYRAYVEMGQYRMVLDDVGPNAPTTLQAAKALAAYHAGGREDKDMAVESLKEWLASSQDQQLLLVAALVFSAEGDYKEALKWVHQSTDLETMAVVAHIYLSMNRVELARKQVGLMQQQDDDATLTKLSGAWVSMAEGDDSTRTRSTSSRSSARSTTCR